MHFLATYVVVEKLLILEKLPGQHPYTGHKQHARLVWKTIHFDLDDVMAKTEKRRREKHVLFKVYL